MSIYVEINIKAALEDVWAKSQTPDMHQRWDLRFTEINYLPRENNSQAQKFSYSTRIGFGLNVSGLGESVGDRDTQDGSRTSALRFWSDDPKSLIREGSGYWKYIPSENGTRFITSYDYTTRFGPIGRVFDGLIFRPLMGWATAWSFDRLRLWLEKKVDPSQALQQSAIYGIARVAMAFIWIYQGLVPKLIFQHQDEIGMVIASGIQYSLALRAVRFIGLGEMAFGLLFLTLWRVRSLFLVNIVLMLCALAAVSTFSPEYLTAAFNPVTLNVAMIALSLVGLLSGSDLPTAKRCSRRRPGAEA